MSSKTEQKIRVIITDNIPLYPPIQGGSHRIFNLYNPLPHNFVLNYIGAASHRIEPVSARINELIIPASNSDKVNHLLIDLLGQNKKWLRGGSLYDYGLRFVLRFNKRFRHEMDKLAKGSDVLIASHPWFFTFIKKYKDKILVYDSHNCEYELLKRRMTGFLWGEIMIFWAKLIEKEACERSYLVLACSQNDKEQLMKYYKIKANKIYVIPNPVDTSKVKPASLQEKARAKAELGLKGKKTVLFIATNFFANNAAADFIVDELAKNMPNFTFLFAGSVKTHFEKTREELPENVVLYGRIPQEDLMNVLMASDIAINPVMHGSGICIKTLDYMAAGIPIVSTQRGMRGINAKNKEHALICKLKDFKDSIVLLYKDQSLRNRLVKNSLLAVKKEFDCKVISQKLAGILERALDEHTTTPKAKTKK